MVRAGLIAALVLTLAACSRDGSSDPAAGGERPSSISPRFSPPEGWAWGRVGAAPQQRYGVASTDRVPLATIVILPGYGEPAEVWFETAADLIGEGYTVWILDRAGQGGSGRYVAPPDLGFIPAFEVETAALRDLIGTVIKPRPEDVVVALTHADGAVVALDAIRQGLPIDGVAAGSAELAQSPDRSFLDATRRPNTPPFGWRGWSNDSPDDLALGRTHDELRGRLRQAWMRAEPELRIAGPSLGWTQAFDAASRTLSSAPQQLSAPVLMINANHAAAELCRATANCAEATIAGARSALHLEADKWRRPWLGMVNRFITERIEARQGPARP